MYAIIEIGGKQYRVEKDLTINVDKVEDQNETVTLNKVLMYADGEKVILGQPYLSNVKITAKNLGVVKGEKVRGIKFKKRKNYTRTLGHRQQYLQLKINDLSVS
ncbi:MAG: 50S ribosomal protein L21 [Spirochaetota bacterium]